MALARPDNSTFAKSTLYAYDITQMITGEQLDFGLKSFTEQMKDEYTKTEDLKKKYKLMHTLAQSGKVRPEKIHQLAIEVMEAEKRVERCEGAVNSLQWQIDVIALEGMITRSQLDFGINSYGMQVDDEIAKMNVEKGKYQMIHGLPQRSNGKENQIAMKVIDSEQRVERCLGAVQAVQWQIDIIDLKEPEALVDFNEQLEEVTA